MARGKKKVTEETIKEWHREGRGRGRLATYNPWVHVLDFYSKGRTHEPFSHKTGRTHQLLSDGEWDLFLFLEWLRDVLDIREQFPLDREITLEIAHTLGVPHKYYPGTNVPLVMTLDFLVDRVRDGRQVLQAFSVKDASAVEDPAVIAQLEVEREACTGMDIEYHLVIKELLPARRLKNLSWIRRAQLDPDAIEPHPGFYNEQMSLMTADLRHRQRFNGSLVDYCSEYDRRYSVDRGVGLRVARMLLSERVLSMDMNIEHPERAHMEVFHLTAQLGELRAMGGQ